MLSEPPLPRGDVLHRPAKPFPHRTGAVCGGEPAPVHRLEDGAAPAADDEAVDDDRAVVQFLRFGHVLSSGRCPGRKTFRFAPAAPRTPLPAPQQVSNMRRSSSRSRVSRRASMSRMRAFRPTEATVPAVPTAAERGRGAAAAEEVMEGSVSPPRRLRARPARRPRSPLARAGRRSRRPRIPTRRAPSLVCSPRRAGGRWMAGTVRAEAGRRGGLDHAVHLHERLPRQVVGVGRGLGEREHRGEAHVAPFHDPAPLVAGPRLEERREPLRRAWPLFPVELRGKRSGVRPGPFEKLRVELVLDRTDRDVPAVLRLVDRVEVAAAVHRIPAPPVLPRAGREHAVHHRHEGCGAVGHGRVHHLPLAGTPGFEEPTHHAEGEIEPAPAEVADEIESGDRGAAPRADRVQRTGEGDVVDVVSGRVSDGTFLPPSRHAAVDEPRVAGEAFVGTEAEPFGDAGPEAFDEPLRLGHEAEHGLASGLALHVDGDRAPAAVEEVVARIALHPEAGIRHPVHPNDVRPHVREHHRAHRPGADPRELDDPEAGKRSHPRHLPWIPRPQDGTSSFRGPAEVRQGWVGQPTTIVSPLGNHRMKWWMRRARASRTARAALTPHGGRRGQPVVRWQSAQTP